MDQNRFFKYKVFHAFDDILRYCPPRLDLAIEEMDSSHLSQFTFQHAEGFLSVCLLFL